MPRLGRHWLDPPPETDDVVVDGAIGEHHARAPREVEELLPAQNSPPVLHKRREQLELGQRHVHGLPPASNLSSREVHFDGYFTVGIENRDQTDGLLYAYYNRYPAGASTVQTGRAIKFVPQIQEHVPAAAPEAAAAPMTDRLDPCRPNPFNPHTTVSFQVAATGPATLRIYDVAGRLISTLVDGAVTAGEHAVTWNGTTGAGQQGGRRSQQRDERDTDHAPRRKLT